VVVGSPESLTGAGNVKVYSGTYAGATLPWLFWVHGSEDGALFGYDVSRAGDANGDGRPDFIAGGRMSQNPAGLSVGSARVYSAAGPGIVPYCTAGTSAGGCQAQISAVGVPSATATSGFLLQATGAEGNKSGIFFYGANGRQANSWGNGTSFQCVTPPVKRGALTSGSGTSGACDGVFTEDLNARWCPTCPKPSQNFGVGAVAQAQLWYRDPSNTSNQTTSLSDALEFVIQP
jgi:hypothetical protein